MRPNLRLLAIAALVLSVGPWLVPGPAQADKLAFSGEHAIKFAHNGAVSEVMATGSGVAIVNSSTGGNTLTRLQLTKEFAAITDTVSVAGPIPEIRFSGVRINPALQGPLGKAGIFAPILTAVQSSAALTLNTLPAAGTIRLCDNAGCSTAITIDLSQTAGGTAVGPGVGGTFTVSRNAGATRITVEGAPWTIGTTTASYRTINGGTGFLTGMGFVSGPASMTGSTLSPTTNPVSGMVQLVTATQTHAIGLAPPNDLSGQITRLTIHFTPEPGLLLLLGSGALAVALLGRQRFRK